jgi:hypothetical protein
MKKSDLEVFENSVLMIWLTLLDTMRSQFHTFCQRFFGGDLVRYEQENSILLKSTLNTN